MATLGLRCSPALRSRVEAAGDQSAVVRAALIVLLWQAGHEVAALCDELAATLPCLRDAGVRAVVRQVLSDPAVKHLFNTCSTDVQQMLDICLTDVEQVLNTPRENGPDHADRRLEPHAEPTERVADPFSGVGMDV